MDLDGASLLVANVCSNLTEWIQDQCGHHHHQLITSSSSTAPGTLQDLHPHQLKLQHLHHHNQHHLSLNHNHNHNHNHSHNLTSSPPFKHNNSSAPSMYNDQEVALLSPLSRAVVNNLLKPMEALDRRLDYYFSDIWTSGGDERTSRLPFMGAGPWKLIYATLVYLYLIKWLLPKLMQPRRPLELNWPIRIYNLFMVVSNIWAFYHGARILEFGLKCFGCEVINHQDYSPQAIELLHYGWLFFMSRLIEWLDTIFFVLRKKERQVTKLHVFHHSFVPLISWTYLKYHPGYTVAFFPLVNTFVHSIMYTYYLLATFGPSIQPYLWWKRYLTSLQIAQFVLILIQLASIPLTGNEKCNYPRGFLYVAFSGAILFLWLFYTYYIDTYSKQKQQQKATTTTTTTTRVGQQQQQQQLAARKQTDTNPTATTPTGNKSMQSSTISGEKQEAILASRRPFQREGSSRALSDAIDNAIDCDFSGRKQIKKFV